MREGGGRHSTIRCAGPPTVASRFAFDKRKLDIPASVQLCIVFGVGSDGVDVEEA